MKHRPLPKDTSSYQERFWQNVKVAGDNQCWLWFAGRNRQGRGLFGIGAGDSFIASRIAYFLATGRDPGSLCVLHTCDNTPCCNPRHLWAGTQTQNVDDMDAKGRRRMPQGEASGMAKLNNRKVREIRRSKKSDKALAIKHFVASTLIRKIRTREIWKHLPRLPGEIVWRTKPRLSSTKVRAVRLARGTQRSIAKRFRISQSLVSLIKNNKAWKDK